MCVRSALWVLKISHQTTTTTNEKKKMIRKTTFQNRLYTCVTIWMFFIRLTIFHFIYFPNGITHSWYYSCLALSLTLFLFLIKLHIRNHMPKLIFVIKWLMNIEMCVLWKWQKTILNYSSTALYILLFVFRCANCGILKWFT